VPTPRIREFEQQFYRYLETERTELLGTLGERKELSDEIVDGLREATEAFKQTFLA
jgi:F-type H+-transporting ATPase subunit alpha